MMWTSISASFPSGSAKYFPHQKWQNKSSELACCVLVPHTVQVAGRHKQTFENQSQAYLPHVFPSWCLSVVK